MFRKYEKTFRIPSVKVGTPGKHLLSGDDTRALLTGKITIEEKIDGANTGIIGGKEDQQFRLQKRGSLVDTSEHPQFSRFKAWTFEKYNDLCKIKFPYIVYGELMWATHHIYYDSLPDWFICFDIWDGTQYIDRQRKEDICSRLNIQCVPLLFEGHVESIDEVVPYVFGKSAYSSTEDREGIQVKNYKKQMRGKLVNAKFVKALDEDDTHWSTNWDSSKLNKLL